VHPVLFHCAISAADTIKKVRSPGRLEVLFTLRPFGDGGIENHRSILGFLSLA